ncbi:glycoside hydrolase family 6 protein [Cryptosporangium sp. NPDC051539]|uniref:glycoside hydrolase family 6 protein n=1 Tax=Cryptosporangium sp. NPDC051539 TaxID=3363962 RepID=UPI00378EA2C3
MTDAPRAGLFSRVGLRAGPYLALHRRGRANGRVLTAGVGAAALGSVVVIGGTSLVAANATGRPEPTCAPVSCSTTEDRKTRESASPRRSAIALPPGLPASPVPKASTSNRPGAGPLGALYVDSEGQAAEWVAGNSGDSRVGVIRDRIAGQPQARWFAADDPGEVEGAVRAYTAQAASKGEVPVLVAYNMTNRDCGGASAGGADGADGYRTWISNFASGLRSGTSIVVLEPDSLPHLTDCLSEGQQQERLDLLAYAAKTIKQKSAKARVYYDVGHSAWLAPGEAARRAERAGARQYGDGIALNTSNYRTSGNEVAYGKQVLAALGGGQMVIDTSRNGNGPAGDGEWCDPSGRKLGRNPTTATGDAKVAAYLWVKRPGESDGCSGSAGQFIAETAYELSS